MKNSRGFTLVEVMVALLVVGLALPAMLKALYQQVDTTAYLREKSMAQWVATNKMAEVRLQINRSGNFFRGERSGITDMADREWHYWMQSIPTEVPDFYRLEITVAREEELRDTPSYKLVGFVYAANVPGADS
jgi:general secretion pathway protein I